MVFFCMTHHHLPARSFLCSLESRGGEGKKKERTKQLETRKQTANPKFSYPPPSPLLQSSAMDTTWGSFHPILPALSRQHRALAPKPPQKIMARLLAPASWGGIPYPWPSNPTSHAEEAGENQQLTCSRHGCFWHRETARPPSCASGDPRVARDWVLVAAKDRVRRGQHAQDCRCHLRFQHRNTLAVSPVKPQFFQQ